MLEHSSIFLPWFSLPLLFKLGKLLSLRLLRKSTWKAELSYKDKCWKKAISRKSPRPEELSSQLIVRASELIAEDVTVNWPLHQTGERY